jgi:V/A-type H+/Na+-transporting ATPase subunit K
MYWLLALMTLSLFGIILLGLYFEIHPLPKDASAPRWLKNTVAINLLTLVGAQLGLLLLGIQDVIAAEPTATQAVTEISLGQGLAMIGIGIPTAFATIGAGIALGPVGAAALAVIAEKPELLGRSLIFIGLAEGIAIYGLLVTILLYGKLG